MSNTTSLSLSPSTHARGQVHLPGSKSISNRVLLLAALSQGVTRVHGLLDSDDTRVMLQALEQLGVNLSYEPDGALQVQGAGEFKVKEARLFLGNAGTAFRPLTAVLAFMGGDYQLSGVPRMHERPIGDLVDALRSLGAQIGYLGAQDYPPLAIGAGHLVGAEVSVKGSVSSQFLTALLLAAPLLVARSGQALTIRVTDTLISKPYIDITLNLMARFGVHVQQSLSPSGALTYCVPASAMYQSAGDITVEGDASSASYFMGLGLIGQGPVVIRGVGADSIQGDIAFVHTIRAMGGQASFAEQALTVQGFRVAQGERFKAFDLDFNHIPDAAMTAAVLAIYADGPCQLRNIGSWRVKETDRIHAMHTELGKLGAQVQSGDDWLKVWPIASGQWRQASIHTYDDHRRAMCFSLATFGPVPVVIEDPGCVAKTFPTYFDEFRQLVAA